jgi:hypothetical protein
MNIALQTVDYSGLPPLCGQTCDPLSSNCSDRCNTECTFDTNDRTWSCVESTCGEAAICKATLPDVCVELCVQASSCGQSCTDQNGFTQQCGACPAPSPESAGAPIEPTPAPPLEPSPPPSVGPAPSAPPTPSTDGALATAYGVSLNAARDCGLFFADSLFQGSRGAELRQIVSATAAEFGINPGLLAVIAVAERNPSAFTSMAPVRNTEVGLDYWGASDRREVMRLVPEARDIISRKQSDEIFINEPTKKYPQGKKTGPFWEFPNGQTALRAVAARIRANEILLSQRVGMEAWNNLSAGTRFLLVRTFYNPGRAFAYARA